MRIEVAATRAAALVALRSAATAASQSPIRPIWQLLGDAGRTRASLFNFED